MEKGGRVRFTPPMDIETSAARLIEKARRVPGYLSMRTVGPFR